MCFQGVSKKRSIRDAIFSDVWVSKCGPGLLQPSCGPPPLGWCQLGHLAFPAFGHEAKQAQGPKAHMAQGAGSRAKLRVALQEGRVCCACVCGMAKGGRRQTKAGILDQRTGTEDNTEETRAAQKTGFYQ